MFLSKKLPITIFKLFSVPVLIGIFLTIYIFRNDISRKGDFISFYVGANIVADGLGKDIYNTNVQFAYQKSINGPNSEDWLLPFRGLPFTLLFYLPFAKLPISLAYLSFAFLNLSVLTIFYFKAKTIFSLIAKYAGGLFFIPFYNLHVIQSFVMGQVSIILALAYLVIYVFLKEKRYFLLGLVSSLFFVKVQHAIFIPFIFLLIKDKKAFIKGLLLSSSLVFLVSYLISGPSLFNYFPFLIKTESPDFGSSVSDMFTFYSLLNVMLPEFSKQTLLFINFLVYFVTVGVFAFRASIINQEKAFMAALFFTLAFSVHLLGFDLAVLLVPLYILINSMFNKQERDRFKENIILIILVFSIQFLVLMGITYVQSILYIGIGLYLLVSGGMQKDVSVNLSKMS